MQNYNIKYKKIKNLKYSLYSSSYLINQPLTLVIKVLKSDSDRLSADRVLNSFAAES